MLPSRPDLADLLEVQKTTVARFQALWALASVSKSKVESRKHAASGILKTARKHQDMNKEHKELYSQFPAFCDQLIRLCHHNPGDKAK